jgi:hypothetical protein
MAKNPAPTTTLEGVVEYLNFSPKGAYEALLIKTAKGQRVQLNFPPDWSDQVATDLKPGDRITAEVEPYKDDRPGDHPVYHLHCLKGVKGLQLGNTPANPIQGKVRRINFAKHGEPNGAVLDSGHFIHLKPAGARLIDLEIGQTLVVEGRYKRRGHGQGQVIEAERVNGIDLADAKNTKVRPEGEEPPPPPAHKRVPAKKTTTKKSPAKKAAAKKLPAKKAAPSKRA